MYLRGLLVLGARGRLFLERYVGRQRGHAGTVGRDVTVASPSLNNRLDETGENTLPEGVLRGVVGGGPAVAGVFLRGVDRDGKIRRGEGPLVDGRMMDWRADPEGLEWFRYCDDIAGCDSVAREVFQWMEGGIIAEKGSIELISGALRGLMWDQIEAVGAGDDTLESGWRLARAAKEIASDADRTGKDICLRILAELVTVAKGQEQVVIEKLIWALKGIKPINLNRP